MVKKDGWYTPGLRAVTGTICNIYKRHMFSMKLCWRRNSFYVNFFIERFCSYYQWVSAKCQNLESQILGLADDAGL